MSGGAPLWLVALLLAFAAIHLTIARRESPPEALDFDRPVERALISVFAWLSALLIVVFAVALDGLWPVFFAAAIYVALGLIRRRSRLQRLHTLAAPAAGLSFVCAIILFQQVFGDRSFGLFSVFPTDR